MGSDHIPQLMPARRLRAADKAERARQYRHRAEEILSVAEGVHLDETRLTLLSLADSYQHMADALEHMHVPGAVEG